MAFDEIKTLAERCQVSMNAACLRAGIAYSTPHRWGKGTEPGEAKLARLRAAVVVIAHERGKLPEDLAGEVADATSLIPAEVADPREIVQDMKNNLRRLERSLKNVAQAAAS